MLAPRLTGSQQAQAYRRSMRKRRCRRDRRHWIGPKGRRLAADTLLGRINLGGLGFGLAGGLGCLAGGLGCVARRLGSSGLSPSVLAASVGSRFGSVGLGSVRFGSIGLGRFGPLQSCRHQSWRIQSWRHHWTDCPSQVRPGQPPRFSAALRRRAWRACRAFCLAPCLLSVAACTGVWPSAGRLASGVALGLASRLASRPGRPPSPVGFAPSDSGGEASVAGAAGCCRRPKRSSWSGLPSCLASFCFG